MDDGRDREPGNYTWPEVVLGIALLIFLSFICTDGWGLFR